MAKNAKAPAAKSGGTIKVKQVGSVIGCTDRQRATVRGLGLRRIRHTVEVPDTIGIRGMLHKVRHMVKVEGL